MNLILSFIGVCSVILGFLNTVLVWKLFGISNSADVWLTATLMINVFSLIALSAIEQFPIYYANELKSINAKNYARDSLIGSLISGVVLGSLFIVIAPKLSIIFSEGFGSDKREILKRLFVLLAPTTMLSPVFFVVRQVFALHEKFITSALVSFTPTLAQSIALVSSYSRNQTPNIFEMAHLVSYSQILMALLSIMGIFSYIRSTAAFDYFKLRHLAISSFNARFAHSFQNLAFSVITNNALSYAPPGSVAIFQYARKFADALSAIAVGPNATVYHARQAMAWSQANIARFKANILNYLTMMLPTMIALVILLYIVISLAPNYFSVGRQLMDHLDDIKLIFLSISVWQLLNAVETIPVGILLMDLNAKILLGCNMIFAILFYLFSKLNFFSNAIEALAAALILAQIISTSNFFAVARVVFKKKFDHEQKNQFL